MVMRLQRLSEYYAYEIRRGHCGLGNYHLCNGLTADPVPASLQYPSSTVVAPDPDTIVDALRSGSVDHAHVVAPSDSNRVASAQPSASHASDVDDASAMP